LGIRHIILAKNGSPKIGLDKNASSQPAVLKIGKAQVTSEEERPLHSTVVEYSPGEIATKKFHCLKIGSSEIETVCFVYRIKIFIF